MKKKVLLNYFCLFLFVSFLPIQLIAQEPIIIQGEAYIKSDGRLVSYDKVFDLNSGDAVISSDSYVYLTLEANANIKSINVTGMLRIQGDGIATPTLTVNGDATAIKCGVLETANNVSIVAIGSEYGINSDSYIEIRGGDQHSISGGTIAVSAGSFITVNSGARMTVSSSAGKGISAVSHFIVDESNITVTASSTAVECKSVLLTTYSELIGNGASTGISANDNIIVDSGSTLSGEGSGSGDGVISLNGFIRAGGTASTIIGKGTNGSNGIVSAKGIYAVDSSTIQESYPSGTSSIANIGDSSHYTLGNPMERTKMYADEIVKIDNTSKHIIILE